MSMLLFYDPIYVNNLFSYLFVHNPPYTFAQDLVRIMPE